MKVYLSSTLIDLIPERQAVKDVLGGECTVVESYTADERSVRDSCMADVAGCDLYIGIIGLRYGFVQAGQTCSITQLEYREARERNVPTLIFVKDKKAINVEFTDLDTEENPRELIEAFRKTLTSGSDATTHSTLFKTPDDLKVQVVKAFTRLALRRGGPKPKPIEGAPYPGLRAFQTNEADRFFGRDAEVDALLGRLLASDQRFLALIGASGSGKSSLVYAGLIPRLQASPTGAPWFNVAFAPRELGDDPFVPLANALKTRFPDAGWRVADLAQRLRDSPADVGPVAKQALAKAGPGAQLLLFVDQFEEVFASKVDAATRSAFFALLAAAVACPLLRVVIAMRADFYALWPQDGAAIALLHAGHFPVAVPGPAALEKMIVGPANAAGMRFEPPQLVQRLLNDTGSAPGALALAEFALSQLYDRRDGNALTEAAYVQIGGVAGAIEGLAEAAVQQAGQALAKAGAVLDDEAWSRLFVAIASVEEREQGQGQGQGQDLAVVRRRAAASELPGPVLTLVQHLIDKRLLVSSAAGGNSGEQPALYEVGHEAVFSHWKRFKHWYALYADTLAARRLVERAAAEWHKAGRPAVLRWGWERQKPALHALHKLSHLPLPPPDAAFTDAGIALWRSVQARLPEPPLHSFLYPEPLALIDELSLDATPHQRREAIGLRLHQLGDPRRGVGLDDAGLPDIDWVDVPAGVVTLEIEAEPDTESDSESKPKRRRKRKAAPQFAVAAFHLARYPVTWCQYRAFLDADDGYRNVAWWDGRPREDAAGAQLWAFASYPAINVSWYDATAFCRWLGAKLGQDIRLPTECEWQWAAVAGTGQEYPWPGDCDAARANSDEAGIGRTLAVGMYPLAISPTGLDDMAGNVWQWCANDLENPESISLPTGDDAVASRVLRGGSWLNNAWDLRAAFRYHSAPDVCNSVIGFRVCRVSPIEKLVTVALATGPLKR